jgi:hypothetical protein
LSSRHDAITSSIPAPSDRSHDRPLDLGAHLFERHYLPRLIA